MAHQHVVEAFIREEFVPPNEGGLLILRAYITIRLEQREIPFEGPKSLWGSKRIVTSQRGCLV